MVTGYSPTMVSVAKKGSLSLRREPTGMFRWVALELNTFVWIILIS